MVYHHVLHWHGGTGRKPAVVHSGSLNGDIIERIANSQASKATMTMPTVHIHRRHSGSLSSRYPVDILSDSYLHPDAETRASQLGCCKRNPFSQSRRYVGQQAGYTDKGFLRLCD
jgi:hypothetical protein